MRRTRRSLLSGCLASTFLTGCLGGGSGAYEEATEDLPPIEADESNAVTVDVAHWLASDAFADAEEMTPHGIDSIDSGDRAGHEAAVADAIVAGSPPAAFQTVLGEELRRYWAAAEIDPLPDVADDLVTRAVEDAIVELATLNDALHALPITATPINGLLVADALETPLTTMDEISEHDLAVPRRGTAVLQLIELVLLGVRGRPAHLDLREGSIHVEPLREVVEVAMRLLEDATWVPPRPTTSQLEDVDLLIPGADLVDLVLHADWRWLGFPGTDSLAVIQATGLARARRGDHPEQTRAVIGALGRPDVQAAIADRALRLPAIDPAGGSPPGLAALAAQRRDADRLIPAIATGCGVDATRRWRAIRQLSPALVRRGDHEAVVDVLRDAFR